ncbi:hypothetical protein D9M73_154920 [compost metagenome]
MYLPEPSTSSSAVGKVAVGPMPQTSLPFCSLIGSLGDSKPTYAMSPIPLLRSKGSWMTSGNAGSTRMSYGLWPTRLPALRLTGALIQVMGKRLIRFHSSPIETGKLSIKPTSSLNFSLLPSTLSLPAAIS